MTPTLYQGQAEPTDAGLERFARLGCGGDDIRWTFSDAGLRRTIRAAIESHLAASSAAPADLHAAIMNLPCVPTGIWTLADAAFYRRGHRDARRAAAQLAAVAAPEAREATSDEDSILRRAALRGAKVVHPAAPSSPSALRAAPFSEPRALGQGELPVRAEMEKDAARYEWMRDRNNSLETMQRDRGVVNGPSCYQQVDGIRELKHGEELDAAIDAAMSAPGGGGAAQ